MRYRPHILLTVFALIVTSACDEERIPEPDKNEAIRPLMLWSDSPARTRIIEFVEAVSNPELDTYVKPGDRIAAFDNDGTLWCEQPMYVQALFAQQTSGEVTSDIKVALGSTHGNRTPEQFRADVNAWLDTARHPRYNRRYDELTYAPMVELLTYLQDHAFTTVISSAGGQEFMRVFAEQAYGIPNEDVIGSTIEIVYDTADAKGRIYRTMKIANVNNEDTKPTGLWNRLGKRPIMAFGNSDGDQQMLEWVGEGEGLRLCGLVHHTDADREYAYDWPSEIGGLNTAKDEAAKRNWIVVDMAKDWKAVFTAPPAP